MIINEVAGYDLIIITIINIILPLGSIHEINQDLK
jgi:hypothetical protein